MKMPPVSDAASPIRHLLHALVAIGSLGLGAELVLLEHYEERLQWLPLIGLGAGMLALSALVVRPNARTVRLFQLVMAAFVILGAIGTWLHYSANVALELEMTPDMGGVALIWTALRGGTPTLAPGALAQVGLLGLIATVGHPALRTAHSRD